LPAFSNVKRGAHLGSQIAEGNFRGVAKLGGRLIGSSASAVRVHGLQKLMRDLEEATSDVHGEVSGTLRELAKRGAGYAASEASAIGLSQSTVAGYKPYSSRSTSRAQWAEVRQSRRKKTGLRPDYVDIQLTHVLDPVADRLGPEVEAALERALDSALRRNGF
jgi:hypothetical protein